MSKIDKSSSRSQAPAFSRFRTHPWHGIDVGREPPRFVNAYIELTPFDGVKYEIDKKSGYIKVDRPQLSSSLPPALYGFIPQTYCGTRVGKFSKNSNGGDNDPLDICVFSERLIDRSDILVPARVIGGFRMIDRGEADDKIVAVLESDSYYSNVKSLKDLSQILRNRLEHYFKTYKLTTTNNQTDNQVVIETSFEVDEAEKVVEASMEDYMDNFGG